MAHNHTLPNMETITSSIESSLENGSLNHLKMSSSSGSNSGVTVGGSGGAVTGQCGSDSQKRHHFSKTIELKSEIPLPEYWEQFLDMQVNATFLPPESSRSNFFKDLKLSFIFLVLHLLLKTIIADLAFSFISFSQKGLVKLMVDFLLSLRYLSPSYIFFLFQAK